MSFNEVSFGDLNYALVTNKGDTRAVLTYNSVPFMIEPGDVEPVPFEAVALWCGDPRALPDAPQVVKVQGGENRYVPSRMDERKRLRQLYGLHEVGAEYEIPESSLYPKLEVKYRGQRCFTVLEDPEGTHLTGGGDERVTEQQRNMKAQVDFLEDQLRILKARFEGGTATPAERDYVEFHEDDLPTDVAPDPGVPPLPRVHGDSLDWATVPPATAADE